MHRPKKAGINAEPWSGFAISGFLEPVTGYGMWPMTLKRSPYLLPQDPIEAKRRHVAEKSFY